MIKKISKKTSGFTLVEILIVVALIAILAVIALITINPAEANKRARDSQRLKEMATLQGVIEQYLTDNIASATTTISSDSTGSSGSNACGTTGWTGLNLCPYANTIPKDPMNRVGDYAVTSGSVSVGALKYQIRVDTAARYRICTRVESKSNITKLTSDGIANDYFEVYSSTDAPSCSF